MKTVVIMWIIYMNDLSSERFEYKGTLADCLFESALINDTHKDRYSGCIEESNKPPYVKE